MSGRLRLGVSLLSCAAGQPSPQREIIPTWGRTDVSGSPSNSELDWNLAANHRIVETRCTGCGLCINWCSLSGLERGMPTYYFNLKGIQERYLDPYGTELADDAQAREHARRVALELMQGREGKTRSWRLKSAMSREAPFLNYCSRRSTPPLQGCLPIFAPR